MDRLATLVVLLTGGQGLLGGGGPPAPVECVTEAEREEARRVVEAYQRTAPVVPLAAPSRFTFYPLGGSLYRDLFTNNFVDLDTTSGLLDWDCTGYTYNGHDASDVDLRTFGEQAIGVPVFSALNGTVIASHDGEDDMNTSCTGVANYVILDHGAGRVGYYWHLRKFSVEVVASDVVKAGRQIGLAASSGCSTAPHLHFAVYDNGTLVEPYAGACRPGPSEWTDQTPIERSLYARDLNVTNVNIGSYPGLPFDIPRAGTFVQGVRAVRLWVNLHNLPANSTWRLRYLRPDLSTAVDSGLGTFGAGNPFYRWSWWWWSYNVNLNATGQWRVRLDVNGTLVAEAPFDVVATAGEIVNRPPYPIAIAIEPLSPSTEDVVRCRVETDLVLDDPDYDIVRYHYVWSVGGNVVRDVTTAGQSDAFPRDTAPAGSWLSCSVTALDALDASPTVVRSVRVRPIPNLARWR